MNDDTKNVQPQEQAPVVGEKKDRTSEQFEKLTKSNQELKSERDQLAVENKEYQSVLDSLMPKPEDIPNTAKAYEAPINQAPQANNFQNLNQNQVNKTFESMVDENGYLDGQKLMQTLQALDERAKKAEERANQVEQRVKQREDNEVKTQKTKVTQELHTQFPMLDPENKEQFNPDFWKAVRNDLIGQMIEGREDPIEAAKNWYSKFYEDGDTVTKKQQAQKAEDQKKQINATRPRSPLNVGYYENEEESALITQVREGKKGSIAELLRRRGQ